MQFSYAKQPAQVPTENSSHLTAEVVIQFKDPETAHYFEQLLNTGADDPKFFKKFDAKQDNNFLVLTLKQVEDAYFTASFLLTISRFLKQNLDDAVQHELLFHFTGEGTSGIAMCLESHGLFTAKYTFANNEDVNKFLELNQSAEKMAKSDAEELDNIINAFNLEELYLSLIHI